MGVQPHIGEYIELHAHSAFSFLDGASQPDELARAAADLGYPAFALTDHDNLCGALEFAHAARDAGITPITGAELSVVDDLQRVGHVTVLCRTAEGYHNLCRLITAAHAPRGSAARDHAAALADPAAVARAMTSAGEALAAADDVSRRWSDLPPGRVPSQQLRTRGSAARPNPLVTVDQLCAHAAGLTVLTGCARRGLIIADIEADRPQRCVDLIARLQAAAGREHVYVELQLPHQRGDAVRTRALRRVAELAGAPVVATGNVHAHTSLRARLAELLTAVGAHATLEACETERSGNLVRALRAPADMVRRFISLGDDAIAATRRIAESIEFDLTSDLGYRYPTMVDDAGGRSADEVLAGVCTTEVEARYAGQSTLLLARARLESELAVVRQHGLSGFFLLHRDVLELAREVAADIRGPSAARAANPPGRGRGSSVESIICYLTGLSHVDPLTANLRMGRFLNDDMVSLPDIDLDFPRDIRHELLRRVVARYGADRCAMVAAHATFRVKSAVRDVGAALGLPAAELARIAKRTDARNARYVADAMGPEHDGPRWNAFRVLTAEIADLPRQIGQHSGGVIVSTEPLDALVPIVPAAMPGRQICQWDKDSCSDAGFLKIDVLGLGMLSAVEECVEIITSTAPPGAEPLDLSRIDYADAVVYDDIAAGDTVGTFQIESRAQIGSLKRTKPRDLHDLTIQVALIRPGPIIGGSVNPYIAIREARRVDPSVQPVYDHPLLEPVLGETYGAIIFQDQVIEVSMAVAGFTAGEADGLRRAMTRKRAAGSVEAYREQFRAGAARRGVDGETADRIFDRVIGFCHYGFPRAHSVAFAILAYQSAWLRRHYPAHFFCSLLNAQPMGFYPPDSLLRDASRLGVGARPIDVNASRAVCTVEPGDEASTFAQLPAGAPVPEPMPMIRVGLAYIRGISHKEAIALERARGDSAFVGIEDLARRAPLRTDQLESLVMAGACDCFAMPRREMLWQLGLIARPRSGGRSGEVQHAMEIPAPASPTFAQLSLWDEMLLDFTTQGLSTRAHPVELLRPLVPVATVPLGQLDAVRHNQSIDVMGAVIARQKPATAKGMVFMLIEDESGTANVVVSPDLYRRERMVIRGEPIVRLRARLERHGDVVNLIAREVHRLPNDLRGRAPARVRAKNFC